MRRIKLIFPFLAGSLIIICSLLACNEKDAPDFEITNPFDAYFWVGKLHNDFLDNARENYNPEAESSPTTRSNEYNPEEWAELHAMQIAYANTMNLPAEDKEYFINSMNECQRYYEGDVLFQEIFPDGNLDWIKTQLAQLKKDGTIDATEEQLIIMLSSAVLKNMTGEYDNAALYDRVMQCIQLWKYYFETKKPGSGQFSGYILSVSFNSMDWWDQLTLQNTRAVPVIIAHDIAGAILGGGKAALIMYLKDHKIDYGKVALHTAGGAIVASTGIVGKIAKWIRLW